MKCCGDRQHEYKPFFRALRRRWRSHCLPLFLWAGGRLSHPPDRKIVIASGTPASHTLHTARPRAPPHPVVPTSACHAHTPRRGVRRAATASAKTSIASTTVERPSTTQSASVCHAVAAGAAQYTPRGVPPSRTPAAMPGPALRAARRRRRGHPGLQQPGRCLLPRFSASFAPIGLFLLPGGAPMAVRIIRLPPIALPSTPAAPSLRSWPPGRLRRWRRATTFASLSRGSSEGARPNQFQRDQQPCTRCLGTARPPRNAAASRTASKRCAPALPSIAR